MKKIILSGVTAIVICFSTSAQHLLKANYTYKEAAEEAKAAAEKKDTTLKTSADSAAKATASATVDAAKPVFTADAYTSITNNLGGGFTVLPTVKFLGDIYEKKGNGLVQFKTFFSGANFDSIVKEKANQLYFPEASKFGLNLNYIKPFGKKDEENMRPFCLNAEAYYLNKNITSKGIKQADTSGTVAIAHLKLGLEYAIVRNNLSLFWNFNYATALTQRDYFKSVFNYKRNNYVFNEVGVTGRLKLLEPAKDDSTAGGDGLDLYLTFGAIIHSGDTRSLSGKNSDAIVPFVRLGLNINIFHKKKKK